MGNLCSQDIQRRTQKPQTRNIIKKICSAAVTKTEGGIYLPNGLSRFTLDGVRIRRVAAKIARGILFLSTSQHYEEENIARIDLYTNPSEIIKPYKEVLKLNPLAGVYPDVFAHSHINFEGTGCRFLLMLFWKAFIFCVIVKEEESKK